jgi:hypothetical protein
MRKLLVTLCLIVASVIVGIAQQNQDAIVYLNNGSVINGTVNVNETTLTIMTNEGQVYTYPMAEVRKIDYTLKAQRVPKVDKVSVDDYSTYTRGFWCAAELYGGYTCSLTKSNISFTELSYIGGYRFSEFLKVGLGIGARYYLKRNDAYTEPIRWAMPLFAHVRGNFISEEYRTVVPYYSMDMGVSFRDGFMWRPAIGMKIGEDRSAFTVAVSYMGQSTKRFDNTQKYVSAVVLRLGYEF